MRAWPGLVCCAVAISLGGSSALAAGLSVTKDVDQAVAPALAELSYSLTVANLSAVSISAGLVVDDFPDEVEGCSWTCSATPGAWCDQASGSGDIEQIVGVPTGTQASYDIRCTFTPSPGHWCAENRATFNTMDPDTITAATALTCAAEVVILFDGFESGDTSAW